MGPYCTCCGSPIPEGQRTCSMCYGDMGHGRDGYYESWGRDRESEEREEIEREQER